MSDAYNKMASLLNDEEKRLLCEYEYLIKRAVVKKQESIVVKPIPLLCVHLLEMKGYKVKADPFCLKMSEITWSKEQAQAILESDKNIGDEEENIVIYGIVTLDNSILSSLKAFYITEELAKQHLSEFSGYDNSRPWIHPFTIQTK